MSPGVPALSIDGAVKRFGPVTALDGVSFELGRHELLALVGPSGCGKSTVLRAIAGLVRLDGGRITLAGETVDDGRRHLPPEHRHIGLVFQEHALFPHLTVADNVGFGIRDASRREVRQRIDEALAVVELAGYGGRYPHELSGGERQRVALARALAPRPTLLLLDEPFASLDPNLRSQLRGAVVAALRTTGTPAVFVTHDQTEALAIGDRVAVMRSGRVEQLAEPTTVFHQPSSRFVGAFMGEASFLAIRSDPTGPATALGPVDPGPVPTSASPGASGPGADMATATGPGAPMVAMVRPDDVVFHPTTGPAPDQPDQPGAEAPGPEAPGPDEIVGAEFRGATWCYTIRLGDGTEVLSIGSHFQPLRVGMRGRAALTPGHRQVPLLADQ